MAQRTVCRRGDLSALTLSNCFFDLISFDPTLDASRLPLYDLCLIEQVAGRLSAVDMPKDRFTVPCEFGGFDSTSTVSAIRSAKLAPGEKVLLATLRKLFVQSLTGRAENALYRGFDVDEKRYVPDVLKILKHHGLAIEYSRGGVLSGFQ